MKQKDYSSLSDEELLKNWKTVKTAQITSAVLVGIMIGIAVYSFVKKGLSFFTFFPLFFIPMLSVNSINFKAIKKEVEARNLK